MMHVDDYERESFIQRIFDAHEYVPGKTVHPMSIRAMAVDLRTEFERAGARWDEIAHFAGRFLASWRQHPKLSTDEIATTEKAFREGFGLDDVLLAPSSTEPQIEPGS